MPRLSVTGPPFVRRKALLQRVLASSRVRDAIKTSAEKSGHEVGIPLDLAPSRVVLGHSAGFGPRLGWIRDRIGL
eukprot:564738-Rhodomonas_salina.1